MLALIALFGETGTGGTALPALGITPITGLRRSPSVTVVETESGPAGSKSGISP